MRPSAASFEPNAEVDELRWLPVADAAALCTHEPDRQVLADLARTDVPADADPGAGAARPRRQPRRTGTAPTTLRPLDERGPRQARPPGRRAAALRPDGGAVGRRSGAAQTVAPLAERLGLPVGPVPELGEEEFQADPRAGLEVVERLLDRAGRPGVTVVCSQGGAIPSVLMALDVQWPGTRDVPAGGEGQRLGARRPARERCRPTTTATSTPTRTLPPSGPGSAFGSQDGRRSSNAAISSRCRSVRPTSSSPSSSRQRV